MAYPYFCDRPSTKPEPPKNEGVYIIRNDLINKSEGEPEFVSLARSKNRLTRKWIPERETLQRCLELAGCIRNAWDHGHYHGRNKWQQVCLNNINLNLNSNQKRQTGLIGRPILDQAASHTQKCKNTTSHSDWSPLTTPNHLKSHQDSETVRWLSQPLARTKKEKAAVWAGRSKVIIWQDNLETAYCNNMNQDSENSEICHRSSLRCFHMPPCGKGVKDFSVGLARRVLWWTSLQLSFTSHISCPTCSSKPWILNIQALNKTKQKNSFGKHPGVPKCWGLYVALSR